MESKLKILNAKRMGESSYDNENDILFLKARDRDYAQSVDLDDVVIDIDTEGFATGVQLFEASEIFMLDKEDIRKVKDWEFNVKCEENNAIVEVRLAIEGREPVEIRKSVDIDNNSELEGEVVCSAEE